MKFAFTTLLCCIVSNLTLHATTYYVSLSGSNSNTGTSATKPWKSIANINSKNFKGDTILFQGGSTYGGSMYFTSSDVGTASKPIVISSYGSGKATINSGTSNGIYIYNAAGFKIKNLTINGSGRTTNTGSGIFFYMDKSATHLPYIRIESVETYGYHDYGICVGSWNYSSGYSDVSITRSNAHGNGSAGIFFYAQSSYAHKNIYIGYSKVYNNSGIADQKYSNSGNGIKLGSADGAVIEYCTAYNNGWLHSNADGGPMGIWAYQSNNVLIQYNESHHNKTGTNKDGGGFDFDGACTNSTMQYNYSHDNYGGGYVIAQFSGALLMKNITIRYNISENDGRKNDYGAIHMWSSSTSGGVQTVNIYNNTVYITPSLNAVPKGFYIRGGPISGVKVRNNIFQTTGAVQVVNVPFPSSSTFQGNDYWSTGSMFKILWGSSSYSSLNSWRTSTGQEKVNGIASGLQLDPQFSETTTGVTFSDASQITQLKRYKLKSTSGLINKGLNLTSLFGINVGTKDFWGNSIVNKTTFNMGAYQLTTGAKTGNDLELVQTDKSDLTPATIHIFPNPVTVNSTIRFASSVSGKAAVQLYNIEGKLVSTLFSGEMQAGEYSNLPLDAGKLVNGEYFIVFSNDGKVVTQKIIVAR
ncbi:right-handed parallel beta-helix repeat-containing protein [Segetibacter koreensis]|uniref:right-handed parallel beta-helix repeat-containing protein n=1 Tax=Segetibacter koreensis TaxID=398037 RepID=UPI00035DB733|nr:right-handed parallel beta-helix repeat-containing protein [Segetibacter koreensis]